MPTTATYTTLPGTLGGPLSQRRAGQSRFYVPDHQGNTRLLTDSAASLTDTLLTDAWGVEIVSTGTTVNPFKAFGQWGYFSDTISRKLVRARQLIVTNGRWISPDPLSIGMVYAYVESRPTFLADPSGMDPKYDPTYPCDAKIKGRIAEICKKIVELNITSTGNQSPRVRIANCFQESMGKLPAPWSCPPLFSYGVQGSMSIGELLKNMKDLCGEKSKWTIRCDSSKDCTKCANSKVTLSDPGEELVSCVTTLCIAQENDKNCLDLGGDVNAAVKIPKSPK